MIAHDSHKTIIVLNDNQLPSEFHKFQRRISANFFKKRIFLGDYCVPNSELFNILREKHNEDDKRAVICAPFIFIHCRGVRPREV